jgi:hypothetical protein
MTYHPLIACHSGICSNDFFQKDLSRDCTKKLALKTNVNRNIAEKKYRNNGMVINSSIKSKSNSTTLRGYAAIGMLNNNNKKTGSIPCQILLIQNNVQVTRNLRLRVY